LLLLAQFQGSNPNKNKKLSLNDSPKKDFPIIIPQFTTILAAIDWVGSSHYNF
jgi:hypothetical protein